MERGMTRTQRAGWAVVAIALALTVGAMFAGVEILSLLTGILASIWTAALGLLGFAYRDLVMTKRGEGE